MLELEKEKNLQKIIADQMELTITKKLIIEIN